MQSRDPDRTAGRWGDITGCPMEGRTLQLDNALVRFVDGSAESLVGVTLATADPARAGERHTIGGVQFSLG